MQHTLGKISFALGAMLTGALVTGVVMSLPQGMRSDVYADQQSQARVAQQNLSQQNLSTANDLSTAFRNVAEAIKPSVVSISTSQTMMVRQRGGSGGFDTLPPEFRRMLPPGFDDFGLQQRGRRGQPREQEQRKTGSGSGVIVRGDGYILTNNHVVQDADELTVELSDGRELTAEVIGTDPQTDLAVLKIDAGNLQPAMLGNSDNIQVGDWVLAIGSPFGLDQTVTAGIISGKNRVQGIVGDGDGFEDFLQTDAAINPGNSGGPLVNLRGELVGINTAIASRSGGNNGIGFAIPVSMAGPVLTSIIDTGEVRRGFLGAGVGDVNAKTSEEYGLTVSQGALISAVLDDQPAAVAGLQPGDVVTKLDGKVIRSGTQLRNYIASRAPGSTVNVEVNRLGDTLNLQIKLNERTDEAMAMFGGDTNGDFGASLEPLTAETAQRYGYDSKNRGLIVTGVEDGGIAARAGIQAGDILETVNNKALTSANQLQENLANLQKKGEPVRLIVRRGNSTEIVLIR